jgi:hypothetical protein
MTDTINPTTLARRRYRVEAIICMLALAATATTLSLMGHNLSKRWMITIVVLMIVATIFAFTSFVRWTLRTDELNRKTTIESAAIAGGATALIAIIYTFLESMSIGFPRSHTIWTYHTFIFGFAIANVFLRRRYK